MKALIVEDDPIAYNVLALHLSEYGVVQIARDGQEGIQMFTQALKEKVPYDVIFLDIMMPKADGHEVLTEVRKAEEVIKCLGSNGVKIVMCSALDDSKNIIKAFRNQCEGYLTKPICKDSVKDQLKKLGFISQ